MSHWHSDPVTRTQDRHILAEHTAMPGHVLPLPRLLCTWTRTYWSSSIPIKYRRFWGNPSVCALRPRRLLLVASSYETFLDFALSMPHRLSLLWTWMWIKFFFTWNLEKIKEILRIELKINYRSGGVIDNFWKNFWRNL